MPGFYITNCNPVQLKNQTTAPCIQERMQIQEFTVCRNTRDQFLDDKLFFQDENYAVVLEGVILNKAELLARFAVQTLREVVLIMIQDNPEYFYKDFRGMFSGAVYFVKEKKWIVFTDHIGNRAVFYHWDGCHLIVGSQLNYVVDTMKSNALQREANQNGLLQFISYGCYMDESTCLKDVKRILPGDYIRIQGGQLSCCTYYNLPEQENPDITDEEAIALLDEKFRQAVKRGLDKNKEYNYVGILDISGGADSRMNAYVARALGSKNEIMVHYSQSGSNEARISKKIARELRFPFYYKALDDAEFLKDVDEIIEMNSGTGYYCGITGGKQMLQQLSDRPLGIEFTGLLGDVYDGAMVTFDGNCAPSLKYTRYKITHLEQDEINVNTLKRFRTNNAFWLYTRGMLCGMSTFLTRQNYVEPYAPYGDVDFLEACMSIPWERKVNDRLQLRWLAKCYPAAMKHPYAVTGMKLSLEFHKYAHLFRRFYAIQDVLFRKITGVSRFNMNPFDYWEREKAWIMEYINNYFVANLETIQKTGLIDEGMLQKIKQIYELGGLKKYVALSIISSISQYIC